MPLCDFCHEQEIDAQYASGKHCCPGCARTCGVCGPFQPHERAEVHPPDQQQCDLCFLEDMEELEGRVAMTDFNRVVGEFFDFAVVWRERLLQDTLRLEWLPKRWPSGRSDPSTPLRLARKLSLAGDIDGLEKQVVIPLKEVIEDALGYGIDTRYLAYLIAHAFEKNPRLGAYSWELDGTATH